MHRHYNLLHKSVAPNLRVHSSVALYWRWSDHKLFYFNDTVMWQSKCHHNAEQSSSNQFIQFSADWLLRNQRYYMKKNIKSQVCRMQRHPLFLYYSAQLCYLTAKAGLSTLHCTGLASTLFNKNQRPTIHWSSIISSYTILIPWSCDV